MKKTPYERQIQERLARFYYPCEIEVQTPSGRVDILTPFLLIEIKETRHWKHGVGQLLAYKQHYPNHQLVLYLFGEAGGNTISQVAPLCKQQGIYLTIQFHKELPKPLVVKTVSII